MVREMHLSANGDSRSERSEDLRSVSVKETAQEKLARIEARRPKISKEDFEREFSIMLKTGAKFNSKGPWVKGNEDLFYLGEDGKLRMPDFMVSFLRNEYHQKWGGADTTYRDINYFVSRGPLSRENLEGVFLSDTKPDLRKRHIEFTSPQRMRDEYRRVQIARMSPEEAARALQEDRRAADADTTHSLMGKVITEKKFEEGLKVLLRHLLLLRQKGYSAADIKKFIQESDERIRKLLSSEPDENLKRLVLERLDKISKNSEELKGDAT